MKILIEKEEEINLDSSRATLGTTVIWFWVRAYANGEKYPVLQKCYRTEDEAQQAYAALVEYHRVNGKIGPIISKISEITIP